jgi:hypothetical protein
MAQLQAAEALTSPLASNANQSPVPVGSSPMDLHFQNPTPSVKRLHATYTNFCNKSVENAAGSDFEGANWAKARFNTCVIRRETVFQKRFSPEFIPDRFLNGVRRSINTILMLNICTPPPDMYSMKACIGNDFAGEIAKSHAFFSFILSYASGRTVLEGPLT